MFNIRLFQEQLKDNLTAFENKFLVRVFSYGSVLFFGFGLLFLFLSSFTDSWLFHAVTATLCTLIAVGLLVFFYFLYQKYSESPVDSSKNFITKTYSILLASYFFVIMLAIYCFKTFMTLSGPQLFFLISFIFIFASIVYAIPAIIGAVLIKQKIYLALNQFLKYCGFLYAIIFTVFMIVGITVGIMSFLHFLALLMIGSSVAFAPILSFYRLKMTARYIDYTNPVVVYKWELFFLLQMLLQLLLTPIYMVKFVCLLIEQKHKRKIIRA